MASPELDRAINMFRSAKAETQSLTSVDQFRVWYEQFTAQFPLDDDVVCQPVGAGGVTAEWIYGPDANEDRVLVYLHGGGYIIGSNAHTPGAPVPIVQGLGSAGPGIGLPLGARTSFSCSLGGLLSRVPLAPIQRD